MFIRGNPIDFSSGKIDRITRTNIFGLSRCVASATPDGCCLGDVHQIFCEVPVNRPDGVFLWAYRWVILFPPIAVTAKFKQTNNHRVDFMVTASNQKSMSSASLSGPSSPVANGRSLFRIVSFACLAGFVLDMMALAFPLKLGDLAWRVGLLQQVGDRSIILLLGLVFLMLGSLEMRNLRKQVAIVALGIGLTFMIFGVIGIKDAVSLQKQTSTNITTQSTQLQDRIQQAKEKPPANAKVTPELIDQAMKQVTERTDEAQKSAQTQILKTGLSSVGNLFIVGLALIGVGRYGMRAKG